MELSERKIVVKNMAALVENTKVNAALLEILRSQAILSDDDLREIDSMSGEMDRAWLLYSRLMSRRNSFKSLIDALQDTHQTGALSVLVKESSLSTYSRNVNQSDEFNRKITNDMTCPLGVGSSGAPTYKGKFGPRDVAVKVIRSKSLNKEMANEIDIMTRVDYNENIVRFFGYSFDITQKSYLLAMELCQISLLDWILKTNSHESKSRISKLDVLHQTTNGIAHLHNNNIIHGSLRPRNILFRLDDATGDIFVKISLLSTLCKRYFHEHIADEEKCKKLTSATDIFNLGCVYHFVISDGKYKFEDYFESHGVCSKLLARSPELLEEISDSEFFIKDGFTLMRSMICMEEIERPRAPQILLDPLFWDERKMLQFVVDVNDALRRKDSIVSLAIESKSKSWVLWNSDDWKCSLSPNVLTKLQTNHRNRYNGASFVDLLRLIRNMATHYYEEPQLIRNEMGSLPASFMQYWTSRFPNLIRTLWLTIHDFKDQFPSYYRSDVGYKFKI